MNLKRHVFISSVWSLIGSGGQPLIGFLLFVYVARKLAPADIGLVALAMVFIDIFGFASRCGQVEVLQRRAELDDRTASTSFWLLVSIGSLATAIIFAGAETLGQWAEEPGFSPVLALLAPICAFQAFNAVPEALLKRRFNFRSLAIRSWLATLVGGGVGVYLAYNGYGVYSLVGQRLATAVVQTITVWTLLRWHPRFAFDFDEAKRLVGTGVEIMLAGFAGILNLRIANAITGFSLGAAQLGVLRFGWRFFDFMTQLSVVPVSSVALTTFSKVQHDIPALRRAYLRLTQFMALGSLPMFFGLAAVADVFIPLVFGPKWTGAIQILEMLSLIIVPGTINYFFGPALIAVGKTRIVLRQSVAQVIATAVLIYAGSFFGLLGVMIAYMLRAVLVAVYNVLALNREIGLTTRSVLQVLLPPTASCLAMVVVVVLAKEALADEMSQAALLVVLVAIGALSYGASLLLGDLAGLWRGYVRSAAGSLAGAWGRRVSVA